MTRSSKQVRPYRVGDLVLLRGRLGRIVRVSGVRKEKRKSRPEYQVRLGEQELVTLPGTGFSYVRMAEEVWAPHHKVWKLSAAEEAAWRLSGRLP